MRLLNILLLAGSLTAAYSQTASRYNISTFAGVGTKGYSGEGGSAVVAQLNVPYGIAVNSSGVVYVTDQANNRIRSVSNGTISLFAGSGSKGFSGDAGQATSASLSTPAGIAVDSSGNVYFADSGNAVIRKITTGGVISTVGGSNTKGAGFSGDNGTATDAQLNNPLGIAISSSGVIYIADLSNSRIRQIGTDGKMTTVAGSGGPGFWGDGGKATSAGLNRPTAVAVDAAGNLYIADQGNHRIRKVAKDGTITTVAGTGNPSYSGDMGLAINANLQGPTGVAVDAGGNLYIADTQNSRVRRVSATGIITTVAGNGKFAYSGDGDLATSASLFFPIGVTLDKNGNVYVADTQNEVIRLLSPLADFSLPPKVSGVIGAGGFGGFQTVAPGSWVEIYGSDLAVTARQWAGSDFVNRTAPTVLDGTSVKIGGIDAPVAYISGGQVNALVPMGLGTGSQTVTVSTLIGTSAAATIQVDATRPALYAPSFLNVGSTLFAGALLGDGSYAAPENVAAGIKSRPARAGETITLYGTGFGPVTPDVATGQIAPTSTALNGSLQVTIGGLPATVGYAGLAPGAVGLYQINVTIPPGVTAGIAPLAFTLNGTAGQQKLSVAIQ